ncbi:MAG: hypothetical protein AAB066_03870 [Candidatus Margulisiibacteriota bacterium]
METRGSKMRRERWTRLAGVAALAAFVLVVGMMPLLPGCGRATPSSSGGGVSTTPTYDLTLTITTVDGTVNTYHLEWGPSVNVGPYTDIRIGARYGGGWIADAMTARQTSVNIVLDVNTTYSMHVRSEITSTRDNRSASMQLSVPLPDDYPRPVSLSVASVETLSPEGRTTNIVLTWTQSTLPASEFGQYEVWDITNNTMGYYQARFPSTGTFDASRLILSEDQDLDIWYMLWTPKAAEHRRTILRFCFLTTIRHRQETPRSAPEKSRSSTTVRRVR